MPVKSSVCLKSAVWAANKYKRVMRTCNQQQQDTKKKKTFHQNTHTHTHTLWMLQSRGGVKLSTEAEEKKRKQFTCKSNLIISISLCQFCLQNCIHMHKGIQLLLLWLNSSHLSIFYSERQAHVHLIGSHSVFSPALREITASVSVRGDGSMYQCMK